MPRFERLAIIPKPIELLFQPGLEDEEDSRLMNPPGEIIEVEVPVITQVGNQNT